MTTLTEDELDDFLYFARVNELDELQKFLNQTSSDKNCSILEIVKSAVDEDSGNTALHYASANGHEGVVKVLVEGLGAKEGESNPEVLAVLNAKNASGNTALHWAALNGHVEVLLVLLQHGADPSILNTAGHDALFEAELNEKTKAAEVLLAEGKELESTVRGASENGAEEDGEGEGEEEEVELKFSMGEQES